MLYDFDRDLNLTYAEAADHCTADGNEVIDFDRFNARLDEIRPKDEEIWIKNDGECFTGTSVDTTDESYLSTISDIVDCTDTAHVVCVGESMIKTLGRKFNNLF